jgi:asparagine synthase (glutamine-hydrolysing)
MCGIVGIWSVEQPIESCELENLVALLSHRGPDDAGTQFINSRLGLGHTRLSIIDLSAGGHQPMRDRATGNVVTYNGEIYNYRELRNELASLGHEFSTSSDTEVLLKAYAEWGEEFLARLHGMFAFILWDAAKDALFAARDRLGIKPLYYFQDDKRVMMGSEIKVFQTYLQKTGRLQLNEQALPYYLTMRSVPTEQTLMNSVLRVPAGSRLWIDDAGRRLRQKRYWRLEDYAQDRSVGEDDAIQEVETRLRRSIKRRLVADVPVGCFLSGGIDSSLVTLLASQESSSPIHSFSVDFEEAEYSEKRFFDHVANLAHTHQHVFKLDPRSFIGFLDDWVFFMDDLVSDPSSLPLYFVAKEAHRIGIKVVLSGEGADELFGGYESYRQALRYARLRPLVRLMPWAHRFVSDADHRDLVWRLGSEFPFRGTAYVFGESYRRRFLKSDFALDPWIDSVYRLTHSPGRINRMLFFDMATRIPSDLLIRTDRVTMATSVECRVPFLDHELVEAVLGMPEDLKINNGTGKYLLKRLARRYLPHEMVYRPKMGFSTPLAQWFRNELRPLCEEVFLRDQRIRALNYTAIAEMLGEHWEGRARHEGRIWNLLALELWHRRWIENRIEYVSSYSPS